MKSMNITGTTRQLAVLGNPIEHSYSPQLHNFLSERLGKDYVYTALRVENIEEALVGIRSLGFCGVNITAPFKTRAAECMDVLSDTARECLSVNTCVIRDGRLFGYSTDAEGFYLSLLHEGITPCGKHILFVGAGGVTLPVAMLFAHLGAESITITNRTQAKAEAIVQRIREVSGFCAEVSMTRSHYDLIINTTSVGLYPEINASPVEDMHFADETSAVADMIYNPEKTLFLKQAEAKGAKTVNGLGMLVYQGILAYELFTDCSVDRNAMYEEIMREVFGK